MRAAGAVILVAATVVVIAGCGGGNHDRRNAVNTYFDRVDAVQGQVRLQAVPIENAFARFSTVQNSKSETRALVRADGMLERTLVKLKRVSPPVDAKPVHADLVQLYSLEAGVAHELVAMTRFVPRYDAVLTPLKPAHTTLTTNLKTAKGWKEISAAFERYRVSLAGVLVQLRRLSSPTTLRPAFDGESAALVRSIALCASIETALQKHDAKLTAAGVTALSGLGTQTSATRVQREMTAAAKAYNARLARIASLNVRIGRERNALVGELG
jgi:hypothetical protein